MNAVLGNGWEEPSETAVRVAADVRPTCYPVTDDGMHPDRGGCPAWCFIGQEDGWEHEIDPRRPMTAKHILGTDVATVASRYAGTRDSIGEKSDRRWAVQTASLHTGLEQAWRSEATVTIALRSYPGGSHTFQNLLKLSLEDARDLVKALQYVLELSEL